MLLKSAAPWARHCSLGLLKGHTGGISAALPGDAGELHRATAVLWMLASLTLPGLRLGAEWFLPTPPPHTHASYVDHRQSTVQLYPVSACPKQQGTGQAADEMGDGKLTRSRGR